MKFALNLGLDFILSNAYVKEAVLLVGAQKCDALAAFAYHCHS